jgi:hypothetical protein
MNAGPLVDPFVFAYGTTPFSVVAHDGFKHHIELVKGFMEDRKQESQAREQQHEEFSADDNDTRSVATVVPHELRRVDEEDEEAATEHEDRHRSSRGVGRPRTDGLYRTQVTPPVESHRHRCHGNPSSRCCLLAWLITFTGLPFFTFSLDPDQQCS